MATKAQEIRDDLSDELLTLAEVLENSVPGFDGGALKQAAVDCKRPTEYGRSSWGYRVPSLSFPDYEPSSNIRPESAGDNPLHVEMEIEVAGRCEEIERGSKDPFHHLEFNLLIWGSDGGRRLLSAWHLDRHIHSEGDSMGSNHPAYHFQFGGRKMWNEVSDYGEVLVVEPPRLAHPPVDAVLGINFILANYFDEVWTRLMEESEYYRLIVDAQNRFWRPYAEAIATAWEPGPFDDHDWIPNLVWPQLIDDYSGID